MTGAELIAKERQRQIEEEGWTAEHDNQHALSQLAVAGACYALNAASALLLNNHEPLARVYENPYLVLWPWDWKWWRPTPQDPIRQLVKAGALIAAEIDRLQRAAESTSL